MFLDFGESYAHQFLGKSAYFGGGCEIVTTFWGSGIHDQTIVQSGFVEIWSNSVRFSTFLGTEWEFLHAVFTTMRYFDYKNRKWERLGSQVPKTQSALEVLNLHSDNPETCQKSRVFDLESLRKRYKLF